MVAARGFGAADPVAPNDTGSGRAKDHRAVLALASAPIMSTSAVLILDSESMHPAEAERL
jgi:hypothetical protein